MTELIDEAEKIEAGQHNEFWIPAHLDLHLRPHFAPKSLNSPHHTLHWILSIGVAFTNRFVVFCSTLNNENGEYSNRWPRQSNVSRPQDLKPQVAGSGRICRGEVKEEIAE